jgi:lipopolysaccharide/colanic/teichoic acid biosynthesis glycosyltransferase
MKTMINQDIQQQRNQQYRYVNINDTDPLQRKQENFFYVGENISLVANLADSFQMGYASAVNLQQALSFMNELQKDNFQFKGVMIDVPLHKMQLTKFVKYISGSSFARLPLVYVSTYLSEAETNELSAANAVDDIVHPVRDIFTIGERMDFLAKVKNDAIERSKSSVSQRTKVLSVCNAMLKRTIDIVFASVLLVLALPIMALIAVLIKLESSGPVFHNAYRAGCGYRVFKFYRFRTNKVGTARLVSSLSQISAFRDNGASFISAYMETSLTRLGGFLRRTSLDELPQLLNVLKGDMSIVGNRPLPLNEAVKLTNDEFAERFNAPAGLTGLWQISMENEQFRVSLDLEYARQHDLLLDLEILVRTPSAWYRKMMRS